MPTARRSPICLNCGKPDAQAFCPHCSQPNIEYPVSLSVLVSDWFAANLSIDSRLGRTLKPWLFAPGSLTQAFLSGKRVQYTSPFNIFGLATLVAVLLNAVSFVVFTHFNQMRGHDSSTLAPPVMLLVSVPLTAWALRVLHFQREVYFGEHFIASLHLHAFTTLTFSVCQFLTRLADLATPNWSSLGGQLNAGILLAFVLTLVLHIYGMLGRVYPARAWAKTLRTGVMTSIFLFLFFLAAALPGLIRDGLKG
jgi:hypothetical protein